jgi:hypothetical protein
MLVGLAAIDFMLGALWWGWTQIPAAVHPDSGFLVQNQKRFSLRDGATLSLYRGRLSFKFRGLAGFSGDTTAIPRVNPIEPCDRWRARTVSVELAPHVQTGLRGIQGPRRCPTNIVPGLPDYLSLAVLHKPV